jgi:antibiotic biosynthesis monooxygenase (ABM) superfamily enzyme
MLVSWLLHPIIDRQPPMLQALYMALGIVGLLTWMVMPVLVRILKPWLHDKQKMKGESHDKSIR